jgi:hypothetical protein
MSGYNSCKLDGVLVDTFLQSGVMYNLGVYVEGVHERSIDLSVMNNAALCTTDISLQ